MTRPTPMTPELPAGGRDALRRQAATIIDLAERRRRAHPPTFEPIPLTYDHNTRELFIFGVAAAIKLIGFTEAELTERARNLASAPEGSSRVAATLGVLSDNLGRLEALIAITSAARNRLAFVALRHPLKPEDAAAVDAVAGEDA